MIDLALGQRAVACKAWRWMPGMRVRWNGQSRSCDVSWWRVLAVGDDGFPMRAVLDDGSHELHVWGLAGQPGAAREFDCVDLSDPATLGCLLALVREAWGEPTHTAPCDDGAGGVDHWRAWPFADLYRYWSGDTEAEALIAALEAAPEKP